MMRVNLKKSFFTLSTVVLMVAMILAGAPALAQVPGNELSFEDMRLMIMPEYDLASPQVLVIYEGVLYNRDDKPFSGDVVFYVPKGADVRATCELSSDPLRDENPNHNHRREFAKIAEKGATSRSPCRFQDPSIPRTAFRSTWSSITPE